MLVKKKLIWWDKDGKSYNKEFNSLIDVYGFIDGNPDVVKAVIYTEGEDRWVFHSSVERKRT